MRHINDLTIGPDGAAYVTGTSAEHILRLPAGGRELDVWAADPRFEPVGGGSLDGIAFGDDGTTFVMIEGSGTLDLVTVHGDAPTIDTIQDNFVGPTGVTLVKTVACVAIGQPAYVFDPAKRGQSPRLPFVLSAEPLRRLLPRP